MSLADPRAFLRRLFDVALAAVDPLVCTPPYLPEPPRGRTVAIGFGKAAAAMARAVEDHWDGPLSGLAVTRYDHGLDCRRIEVIEAAHPVPDHAAVAAASRALAMAADLGPDDLLLALASGGGSSLLTLPASGLSLDDKRAVTAALLRSGAPIGDINTVRRHLSAIKGGRLAAAAAPARVVTLVVSDVPGDDPAQVASGPTLADGSTAADALAVLARWRIDAPRAVLAHLSAPATPVPAAADPARVIATARMALDAAAARARAAGIEPVVLGDALQGEARELGRDHAILALGLRESGRPAVVLSGGETTVTVKAPRGRGGRNGEYLAGLALTLDGVADVHALACDTDGIDGTQDNAGAVVGPDTLVRARTLGLDAAALLDANDAWSLFDALGDLVATGPTRTNVNDFRAIYIAPAGGS
ncbi:MAG TPA: glycerate kinase [Caulobacteraceae bacterium]|jgi:hydroxypyruvate reductase|nr:glycerate kinase [Caulobacteraceae bacterium]